MNTSIPFPSTSHNDNNFSILEHTNNDEKDSKQDRGNEHTETNSKKNDKDKYKYCPDYDSLLLAIKPKLKERFHDHMRKREVALLAAIKKV